MTVRLHFKPVLVMGNPSFIYLNFFFFTRHCYCWNADYKGTNLNTVFHAVHSNLLKSSCSCRDLFLSNPWAEPPENKTHNTRIRELNTAKNNVHFVTFCRFALLFSKDTEASISIMYASTSLGLWKVVVFFFTLASSEEKKDIHQSPNLYHALENGFKAMLTLCQHVIKCSALSSLMLKIYVRIKLCLKKDQ